MGKEMRVTKICKTKQELHEYNEPGVAAWLNPETECWEHVVIQGPPIIVELVNSPSSPGQSYKIQYNLNI
jgi:hypothetical protein